jgi:hypothetical protein
MMNYLLIAQGILILQSVILGCKDGATYKIFGRPIQDYSKVKEWLKWWHFYGAFDYILLLSVLFFVVGWKILIAALLIRVSVFDLCYNWKSGLSHSHIGTEAVSDKIFAKIFGPNGARKKALVFLLVLIILNGLNYFLWTR